MRGLSSSESQAVKVSGHFSDLASVFRRLMLLMLVGILFQGDLGVSAQTIIYVRSTGSDTTFCGLSTGTSACRSVTFALERVNDITLSNGIVDIGTGTFELCAYTLSFPSYNLVIRGVSSSSTILRCTTDTDNRGLLVAGNENLVTIQNVRFQNYATEETDSGAALNLISAYGVVTVNNCEFRSCSGFLSGAIGATESDLEVKNSVFINNTAVLGGGISFAFSDFPLIVTNTSFISHTASVSGGAIYVEDGSVSVETSSFENCTASRDGGAVAVKGESSFFVQLKKSVFQGCEAVSGSGGAVSTSKNKFITIFSCSFYDNYAQEFGGAVQIDESCAGSMNNTKFLRNSGEFGGAIHVGQSSNLTLMYITARSCRATAAGGFFFGEASLQLQLSHSTFTENFANARGGSIYFSESSKVTIQYSSFEQNEVGTSDGGSITIVGSEVVADFLDFRYNVASRGAGGAVSASSRSSLEFSNIVFKSNSALSGGSLYIGSGSFMRLYFSDISDNVAENNGGGITITDGQVSSYGMTFINNSCDGSGGAIYGYASILFMFDTDFGQVSSFEFNSAGQYGGAIHLTGLYQVSGDYFVGNKAQEGGGALYVVPLGNYSETPSPIYIFDCEFHSNEANYGGAVTIYQESTWEIYFLNSVFSNNIGNGFGGGAIWHHAPLVSQLDTVVEYTWIRGCEFFQNVARFMGGAVVLINVFRVDIENTIFKSNDAETGYGGSLTISNSASSLISNSEFLDSTSLISGGCATFQGLEDEEENGILIENSIFDSCFSFDTGGAVDLLRIDVVIVDNVSLTSNTAVAGGAMHIVDSKISVRNSVFKDNVGRNYGGALYLQSFNEKYETNFNVITSVFQDNSAEFLEGGAIFGFDVYQGSITLCSFISNQASSDGGSISFHGNNIAIFDSNFTNNNANYGDGGAILVNSVVSSIENSQFINNHANDSTGGSIRMISGTSNVFGNIFKENLASDGSGLAFSGNILNVYNNSFVGNKAYAQPDCDSDLGLGRGAALFFFSCTSVKIFGNQFEANLATLSGSVYFLLSPVDCSDIEYDSSNSDSFNIAGSGGIAASVGASMWLMKSSESDVSENNDILLSPSSSLTTSTTFARFGNRILFTIIVKDAFGEVLSGNHEPFTIFSKITSSANAVLDGPTQTKVVDGHASFIVTLASSEPAYGNREFEIQIYSLPAVPPLSVKMSLVDCIYPQELVTYDGESYMCGEGYQFSKVPFIVLISLELTFSAICFVLFFFLHPEVFRLTGVNFITDCCFVGVGLCLLIIGQILISQDVRNTAICHSELLLTELGYTIVAYGNVVYLFVLSQLVDFKMTSEKVLSTLSNTKELKYIPKLGSLIIPVTFLIQVIWIGVRPFSGGNICYSSAENSFQVLTKLWNIGFLVYGIYIAYLSSVMWSPFKSREMHVFFVSNNLVLFLLQLFVEVAVQEYRYIQTWRFFISFYFVFTTIFLGFIQRIYVIHLIRKKEFLKNLLIVHITEGFQKFLALDPNLADDEISRLNKTLQFVEKKKLQLQNEVQKLTTDVAASFQQMRKSRGTASPQTTIEMSQTGTDLASGMKTPIQDMSVAGDSIPAAKQI